MTDQPPSTIPSQFAAVVAARGAHDAIAMVAETLSYAELDRRSARMARALLAAGAGKGARIALLAPDGIFWSTIFLAALRIGAVITVVSTLCTPRELAHILRNSDTQFFIAARRFLNHDYAKTLEAAFPGLVQCQPGMLKLADAPYLRSIWIEDAAGTSWAAPVETLLAGADTVDAALLAAAEAQVFPSDEAVIVYTSGSTSQPKAVIHTQWNIARHPPELAKLFLIKPDDRMLPMLPAFWLGGMAMFFQVLSQGATLVYPAAPDLEILVETIKALKVSRLNGWGDGLARLRKLAPERGIDIDAIVSGLGHFRDEKGALIPVEYQSAMLGMSETFAPHSAEPLNYRMPADKPFCCGRPVNGFERRVVDPETGDEVPVGEVGELQLGGALMKGLYKQRDSEVFTPDGFYPTGDLVRIDADDYLYFVARRNDMIKTRAANVSRLEVEAALNELPEVALSVVAGLDDADFGQLVVAAVVPAAGAAPSEEGLRAALRDSISSYKVPRRIIFIEEDQIPRTATGKIKLHEIAGLFDAQG